MSSGTRPGGLTALAVLNFIGGGIVLLLSLGTLAVLPLLGMIADEAATSDMPPEQLAQFEALQEIGATLFLVLGLFNLAKGVLLIVSGIGYLKLKRVLGRMVGNAYGILGIASTLGTVLLMPMELGGGSFNIGSIIGLIYPVLTLVLINTAFREDLVR